MTAQTVRKRVACGPVAANGAAGAAQKKQKPPAKKKAAKPPAQKKSAEPAVEINQSVKGNAAQADEKRRLQGILKANGAQEVLKTLQKALQKDNQVLQAALGKLYPVSERKQCLVCDELFYETCNHAGSCKVEHDFGESVDRIAGCRWKGDCETCGKVCIWISESSDEPFENVKTNLTCHKGKHSATHLPKASAEDVVAATARSSEKAYQERMARDYGHGRYSAHSSGYGSSEFYSSEDEHEW